jgi:hypothetical protein
VGTILGVLCALLGLGLVIFLVRRKKPQEKESYASLQESLLEHDGLEMMESAPLVDSGSSKNAALLAAVVPTPVWLKYVLTGAHITVKSEYGGSQTTGATVKDGERFTIDQQVTVVSALPDGGDQVWLRLASTNSPPLNHGWVFAKHPSTGVDLCLPCSTAPGTTGTTEASAAASGSSAPVRDRAFSAVENYGVISTETIDLGATLTEEILLLDEELDEKLHEKPANAAAQGGQGEWAPSSASTYSQ